MKKEEQQEVIWITECQCFTKEEVDRIFKGTVSESNYEILEDFICIPELAEFIQGYSELNGTLRFLIEGEWVSVKLNPKNLS